MLKHIVAAYENDMSTPPPVLEKSPVGSGKTIEGLLYGMLISSLYKVPFQLYVRPRLIPNYESDLRMLLRWIWTKDDKEGVPCKKPDYEFRIFVFGFCGKQKRRQDVAATYRWSFNLCSVSSFKVEKAKGGKKGSRGWIMRRRSDEQLNGLAKAFVKRSRLLIVEVKFSCAIIDEYVGSSYDLCNAYRQLALASGLVPEQYVAGVDDNGFLSFSDSPGIVSPFIERERKPNGRGYKRIITSACIGEEKMAPAPNQNTKRGRDQLARVLRETPERDAGLDKKGHQMLRPELHYDTFGFNSAIEGAVRRRKPYNGAVVFVSCATADSPKDRSGTVWNCNTDRPTNYGLEEIRTPILQLLSMSNIGHRAAAQILHRPMATELNVSHIQHKVWKQDYCVNCGRGKEDHEHGKWCKEPSVFRMTTDPEDGKKYSPYERVLCARVGQYQLSQPLSELKPCGDEEEPQNRFVFRDIQPFIDRCATVSNHCFAMCNAKQGLSTVARAFFQRMGSQLRRCAQYAWYLQPFVIDEIKTQVTRLRASHHCVSIACLSVELRRLLYSEFAKDETLFVLNFSDSTTSEWPALVDEWLHPKGTDSRQRLMVLSQAGSVGLNLMPQNKVGKKTNCILVLPGLVNDERAAIQSSGRFTRVAAVSRTGSYRGYYQEKEDGTPYVESHMYVLAFEKLWAYSNVHDLYRRVTESADNCIDLGSFDRYGQQMETWSPPEKGSSDDEDNDEKSKDSDDSDSDDAGSDDGFDGSVIGDDGNNYLDELN